MLPLKLTMEAFGPYLAPQVVDFAPFSDRFLIYGETGAGKTALLDAMTCALYNRASGGERGGIQDLRCKLAGPEQDTRVEFLFSVRGRRYLFWKRLRAVRRRKKDEDDRAERYVLECGARELLPDGGERSLLESAKPTAQEAAAVEAVGMGFDQFVQVMILPQGKFERFLTADSAEKERILKTLFRADRFAAYQESLARQCREAEERLRADEQALRSQWAVLGVESAEALRDLCAQEEAALAAQQAARERCRARYAACDEAARRAQADEEKFARADRAREALLAAQGEQEAARAAEEDLRRAEAAALCRDALRACERARQEAERTASRARAAEAERVRAGEERAAAADAQDRARLALEEAAPLRQEVERLEAALPEKVALSAAQRAASAAEEARARAEAAAADLAARLARAEAEEAARRERLRDLSRARDRLPALEAACARWAEAKRLADRARELGEALSRARKDALEAQAEALAAEGAALERAGAEADRTEEYFRNAAAELAKRLQDGEPCPVCGSRAHPNPRISAAHAGARERLLAARRALREAQEVLRAASGRRAAAQERVQTLEQQETAARAEAAALPHDPAAQRADEEARSRAARGAQDWQRLQEEDEAQAEAIRGLRAALTQAQAARSAAEAEEARARTRAQEAARRAGDDGRTAEEAQRAIRAGREQIQALEDAQKAAADRLAQAETRAAVAASACARAQEEEARLADEARAAGEALRATWTARGFADEADLAASLRDEEALARLRAQAEGFRARLSRAREEEEAARAAIQGLARPDAEAALAAREESLAAFNAAAARAGAQEERAARARDLQARTAASAAALPARRRTVEKMRVFTECFTYNKGVTLSSFVLSAMLGSVAEQANELLRLVHGGRYRLEVRSARTRARLDGLELQVLDGYFGGERDVRTLSGGEKFLVSLALSLGLSAVVRAQAGGVAMEAIFIDEGFGSLDPASIRDALDVLTRIGAGGKVGIISHVEALRENILQGIEVVKGKAGSRVRLHV